MRQHGGPRISLQINADTDRWEVIQRRPGGKDAVVRDYATAGEAVEHVARANDLSGKAEEPS